MCWNHSSSDVLSEEVQRPLAVPLEGIMELLVDFFTILALKQSSLIMYNIHGQPCN